MLVRSLRPFGFAFSLLSVAGDTWVLVYSAIGRLVHTCIFSGLINPHTCNGMVAFGAFSVSTARLFFYIFIGGNAVGGM